MCGITAVSRAPRSSIPNINLFMRLASYSIEDRGPHATGFAWTDKDEKSWISKAPGRASKVAHTFDLSGARTAIGHTRYATQGKPEKNENNHPLQEEGIILVHNGIVDNDDWIYKQLDTVARDNEVDSQAIACLLAYQDAFGADTPGMVLEENFSGDAALAWLDTDTPHVLHLARVVGRPMWLAQTRKGDLVMASTDSALDFIERTSGVSLFDHEEVPIGTYLQVYQGEIIHTESFTPFEPPKKTTTVIGSHSYGPHGIKNTDTKAITQTAGTKDRLPFEWDDDDDTKLDEFLYGGGDWEFLEWDDAKMEEALEAAWGVAKADFSDMHHYDKVMRNFRDYLEYQAEMEDYVALRDGSLDDSVGEEVTVSCLSDQDR